MVSAKVSLSESSEDTGLSMLIDRLRGSRREVRYTNTVGYKKSDAKDILEVVDNEFAKMGFARILCNPVANLSDATIYRIVARYQASIDRDLWVYRAE